MKINVRKLDQKISKLQALRRLATDPDLSDFIEITGVKSNSNGATSHSENAETNGHGQLKTNVLEACKTLGERHFKAKEVYEVMQGLETSETGTEKSVANMLRLLANEGDLKIIVRGQGRRPTVYSSNS